MNKHHSHKPPAKTPVKGAVKGLVGQSQAPAGKKTAPVDPIKGLLDALKAEQVMALAQKVAAGGGQ